MNEINTINFVIENQQIKEVSKDLLKMMMDHSNFEIGIWKKSLQRIKQNKIKFITFYKETS